MVWLWGACYCTVLLFVSLPFLRFPIFSFPNITCSMLCVVCRLVASFSWTSILPQFCLFQYCTMKFCRMWLVGSRVSLSGTVCCTEGDKVLYPIASLVLWYKKLDRIFACSLRCHLIWSVVVVMLVGLGKSFFSGFIFVLPDKRVARWHVIWNGLVDSFITQRNGSCIPDFHLNGSIV